MLGKVLFVSPSVEDTDVLSEMLKPLSIPVEHAQDLSRAKSKLGAEKYEVILTEAQLPDGSWVDVMKVVDDIGVSSTVVVTHPFADARFWADVLERGGYDVLAQPFCCTEVQRIIANALTPRSENRRIAHSTL
jgi:DNA-binding NtrC family response regulator